MMFLVGQNKAIRQQPADCAELKYMVAEGHELDHIEPGAHATVDQHLHLTADRIDDVGQRPHAGGDRIESLLRGQPGLPGHTPDVGDRPERGRTQVDRDLGPGGRVHP